MRVVPRDNRISRPERTKLFFQGFFSFIYYNDYSVPHRVIPKIRKEKELSLIHICMQEASCPDQICVHHSRISRNKETIVCLPDKVVITIENGEDSGIDAVSYTHLLELFMGVNLINQ